MKKLIGAALAYSLVSLAAAAGEPAGLEISEAWVRALPPGQPNTAAYLTLTNSGAAPVVVVGGSTDIAGSVEIHTIREVDGMQRMEQLRELRVDPGQSVALAPGGTHLMLLELSRMPAVGETVRLCLTTASAAETCVDAAVHKSATAAAPSHPHHPH